jgi:hypothetical protein
MSVHVVSWVLRHSEETLGRRLVLLVLADHAREDGTYAWPSVATICAETRMTRRPVQEALRRLEASGAITAHGSHRSGTTIYHVEVGGADSAQVDEGGAEQRGGAEDADEGALKTAEGALLAAPEPSLEQPSIDQPSKELARTRDPRTAIDDHVFAGAPEGVWKVDRKPVRWDHARLAMEVLAAWNKEAGQELRSRDWLAKIVMRIREYPEATLPDHQFIIRANLADPWWKGAPTPSVIYGNGAQFERAIQQARATQDAGRDDERLEAIVQAAAARRTAA